MECVWSVSKLSTESATQLDSCVSSAVCIGLKDLSCGGVRKNWGAIPSFLFSFYLSLPPSLTFPIH